MDENLVKGWLKTAFDFPDYELTLNDKKQLKYWGKPLWIANKLFVKEFRKAAVHEDTKKDIMQKVTLSVVKDIPIYLIIAFGGYKHFWNPSYPEVDFAELFNLRFMSEYVAPILKVHEPGVILDYESEDVIITWMDNYPRRDIDAYAKSLRELMGIYSRSAPKNFKVSLVRSQEQVDEGKLKARVGELLPNTVKEWASLPDEEIEYRLHRSPNNIMWKGEADWSGLSEEEKTKKIRESKMVNETYYAADFEVRESYFSGGNHIPLVLSWGLSKENIAHWLTLGSTRSSTVDFWSGHGVLEIKDGRAIERVVSHKQYDSIKDKLVTVDAFKDSPLKNLKSLEVGERLEIGVNKDQPKEKKDEAQPSQS
jgi:hypothetical protein